MHVHVCVEAREQPWELVLRSWPPLVFLRQGLSMAYSSGSDPGGLASKPYFPGTGTMAHVTTHVFLTRFLEIGPRSHAYTTNILPPESLQGQSGLLVAPFLTAICEQSCCTEMANSRVGLELKRWLSG